MGFLLIFGGIWVATMVAWVVVSQVFKRSDVDKMKSRILEKNPEEREKKGKGAPAPQLFQTEDRSTGRLVVQFMERFHLQQRLQELLEQAGLRWRPARVVHSCLGLFLIGFFALRVVFSVPYVLVQLAAGVALGAIPLLYISRCRTKRLHRFEEQFPESLEFVARSMRAGHAFSVALEMIHREFQEPLAGEFRRCFDEHNLGMPLDSALLKLSKRVPLLDVHFFVSAVLLQKRTGGNLAEILDKLAYVIRERFKLRGKIRAISAHGRMTGIALTCIPMGVALMMFYVNPSYVGFFVEDEIGNIMAGAAVALQVVGYLIIRKIVSIEV